MVAADLTKEKLAAMTGSQTGNQTCCAHTLTANTYASEPGNFNALGNGSYNDMNGLCVIDGASIGN